MATTLQRRAGWWTRTTSAVRLFVRQALGRIRSLRSAPGRPGVSSGRVAHPATAEQDLSALATSPVVYAALNRTAFGLVVYPIRVYRGYSVGGKKPELLDPERVPWVGSLLRLLQTPDPLDWDSLFPAEPGEHLFAQLIADLKASGNAICAPTVSGSGDIIGLTRLHPQLCRLERNALGEEVWVHRVPGRPPRFYPRRTVSHIRLLSWATDGRAELGVGAGAALAPLVEAEAEALKQTANVVRQGGADVVITGDTPQAASFLASKENREAVAKQATEALAGGGEGRRVMVLGGPFKMEDSGLKPADVRAPETLKAARDAELMALGVVPVAVGGDGGTYAAAVQQHRVQAEFDEIVCCLLEAFLFRPLARHFARRAGGRWRVRADEVTARYDLAGHPGNVHVRSEAIDRVIKLIDAGWSNVQAAESEGLDLPKPEGTPRPKGPQATPGANPAPESGKPARPVGDGGAESGKPADGGEETQAVTWDDLFGRAIPPATPTPAVSARALLWRAVEAKRAASDGGLQTAAEAVLAAERDAYVERAIAELTRAQRKAAVQTRAPSDGDGGNEDPEPAIYAPIHWKAILGDEEEAVTRWVEGLSPTWLDTWEASATGAFAEDFDVPAAKAGASTFAPLEESSAEASAFSRERVKVVIAEGMAEGASVNEIARRLREDQAWSPERALRVARTETVRAESSGQNARYEEALAAGLEFEEEWLSDPSAAQWDRRHDLMDGKTVAPGEDFTLPSGATARGPGLASEVGENVNCRCSKSAKVKE